MSKQIPFSFIHSLYQPIKQSINQSTWLVRIGCEELPLDMPNVRIEFKTEPVRDIVEFIIHIIQILIEVILDDVVETEDLLYIREFVH